MRAMIDKFDNKVHADVRALVNAYTADENSNARRSLARAAAKVALRGPAEGPARVMIATLLRATNSLPVRYANARVVNAQGGVLSDGEIDALAATIARERGLDGRVMSLSEAVEMLGGGVEETRAGATGETAFAWGDLNKMMAAVGEEKFVGVRRNVEGGGGKVSAHQWLWVEDASINPRALAALMRAHPSEVDDALIE
jgi:hypothetical protein